MRNDCQDSSPPQQLQGESEYLSEVNEKFSQLVSILGRLEHEQIHIRQVLDEVRRKQDGSHCILESISESLPNAEHDIVADSLCNSKRAGGESLRGFDVARPEYPLSDRISFGRSEHVHKVSHHAQGQDSTTWEYFNKVQLERGLEVEARKPVTKTRTERSAAKRSVDLRDTAGSRRRSNKTMQLNRKRFTERCILEARLLSNLFTVCNFFVLLTLYLAVQATKDPVDLVSGIHEGLRNKFWLDDQEKGPEACHSPDDIIMYTQRFLAQSFEMASALIDANTFETIDMDRCLSDSVHDICRLKYWKVPQNSNKDNYFNQTLFNRDQLTPNNAMSVMDCAASPPKLNCINRSDFKFVAPQQGNARTFGLTPEDPIIMDSTMDYPYASVIPLTPIVWQTRASRVNCIGFGDQYNKDILGAGDCHANVTCDPDQVTEFLNKHDNLLTGRRQSIFVTYAEPAFACVDRRQGKEAQEFKDKSWSPWATFKDLTEGRSANKGTVRGQEVYWKFVSDVAYLQAPFQVFLRDNVRSCDQSTVVCHASSVHCKDPLEDPNHPMWGESNSTRFKCSYHWHYASQFVSEDPRTRKNTFLTIDTSDFTMAVIVITPFGSDFPDTITLLTVTFSISQSGYISASSTIASVCATLWQWYLNLVFLFIVAATYAACSVKGTYKFFCAWCKSSDKLNKDLLAVFDMFLSVSVIGHSLAALLIVEMPPHVTKELIDAFKINNQQAYFDVIKTTIDYQATADTMRDMGFAISLLLFLRLNMYLSLHPRLAVLARTLRGAGDDMFHLAVYCLLLIVFLTVLGWWSFGHESDAFSSIARSAYRLTRMFAGDALFEENDKPPPLKRLCFLLVYIFLVFFILLNFFLAIIVNMYTAIQTFEQTVNVTDKSLPMDLYDIFKTKILLIRDKILNKIPATAWFLGICLKFDLKGHVADPRDLVSYLMHEGCGLEETAAITPEELLEIRINGKALFTTLEQADLCIRTYLRKVEEADQRWVLEEENPDNLYPDGKYFDYQNPSGSRPGLMRECRGRDDETESRLLRIARKPREHLPQVDPLVHI